ncbi:hypothetical protein [Herbaspirillum sp. YR522]|uniref:hypothetical protein n=1 Tax=Herbaspirillum sp. YR522 TaxID=1144342 RepID=UPI00026FCDAD|nr:hypothetical protein [Herbaspirillum sp. YR522]EJM97548.1 hypothetical protein PMI40_04309 [Herbaspirillum sp. YR522]
MSNLNTPQGNPVQEQGDLQQQQQQQNSPDSPEAQSDDEELDVAGDDEPVPGDIPDVDGTPTPDQVRQTQADQQSDADDVDPDRIAAGTGTAQADIAST